MYGLRLLLKKRAPEYKKVIGVEVDPEKLKELTWNAMGPSSKIIATQQNVHRDNYKIIVEHIDERFRVIYGHIEVPKPQR